MLATQEQGTGGEQQGREREDLGGAVGDEAEEGARRAQAADGGEHEAGLGNVIGGRESERLLHGEL